MATKLEWIEDFEITGGTVQTLDCDNIFSDSYDVYFFTVTLNESSSGNDQWVRIRLINSTGGIITTSNYDYAQYTMPANATYYDTARGANQDNFTYSGIGYADDTGNSGSMYIFNPYDSGSYTFLNAQASSTVGTVLHGTKGIGVYKVAETIRGVRFYTTTYWGSGKVQVYGVKG